MPIGRERQRDLREPIPARALMERQRYRNKGPLEQLIAIRQEALDQPAESRRCWMKSGADGIFGHLLQLTGNNGGEQGKRQAFNLSLASSDRCAANGSAPCIPCITTGNSTTGPLSPIMGEVAISSASHRQENLGAVLGVRSWRC